MSNLIDSVPSDAWELLSPNLTENRRSKMLEVAAKRTNYLKLAIQDLHDPHNISACIRSAEAMGINNIEVVYEKNNFKVSGPSKGTKYWSNINTWKSIKECASSLKKEGYTLCAGLPDPKATELSKIPLDKPLCVIFGNEHAGISSSWLPYIDIPFTIPMVGMVESYNISVAAAITLYDLTQRLQKNLKEAQYFLKETEKQHLLNKWVIANNKNPMEQLELLRSRKMNT